MRVMIVALALLTAGCAALPPEVRIRFPDWMRGQGVSRPADTAAPAPAAAPPAAAATSGAPATTTTTTASASAPAAAPTAPTAAPTAPTTTPRGFTYPTGAFPTVHQAFTAQVAQRFGPGQSQASILAALRTEGYACAPGAAGAQVCERFQPIGQGCEDIFVVTAQSSGGGVGDVRRRCPLGVSGPQGAPLG